MNAAPSRALSWGNGGITCVRSWALGVARKTVTAHVLMCIIQPYKMAPVLAFLRIVTVICRHVGRLGIKRSDYIRLSRLFLSLKRNDWNTCMWSVRKPLPVRRGSAKRSNPHRQCGFWEWRKTIFATTICDLTKSRHLGRIWEVNAGLRRWKLPLRRSCHRASAIARNASSVRPCSPL